jgi:hypothetical protein
MRQQQQQWPQHVRVSDDSQASTSVGSEKPQGMTDGLAEL